MLPDAFYTAIEQDDEALLAFGFRLLRQVLFGERTLEEVANAWEQRVEQRRDVWDARKQAEIERRLADEDKKYAGDGCETRCGDN